MPKSMFTTLYVCSDGYVPNSGVFASAAALFEKPGKYSAVYEDEHALIHIDYEKKEIHFGCSLFEIESCFPELKNMLVPNKQLNEDSILHYSAARLLSVPGKKSLTQSLVAEARKALASIPGNQHLGVIPEMSFNPNESFIDLIRQNKGIVLGELHGNSSPKKILIANMQQLKEIGVKRIFMEHLLADTQGEMLKAYFASPPNTPMPKMLEDYLKGRDKGFYIENRNNGFFALVCAAKKAGIEVIPIDTVASYSIIPSLNENSFRSYDRYAAMNYQVKQRLEEHNKDGGKFIIFCGSGHVESQSPGIPGVAQIAGVPSIVVLDQGTERVEQKFSDSSHHNAKADVLMYVNKNGIADIAVRGGPAKMKQTESASAAAAAAAAGAAIMAMAMTMPIVNPNSAPTNVDIELQNELENNATLQTYAEKPGNTYIVFKNEYSFTNFQLKLNDPGFTLIKNGLRVAGRENTFQVMDLSLLTKIKFYMEPLSPDEIEIVRYHLNNTQMGYNDIQHKTTTRLNDRLTYKIVANGTQYQVQAGQPAVIGNEVVYNSQVTIDLTRIEMRTLLHKFQVLCAAKIEKDQQERNVEMAAADLPSPNLQKNSMFTHNNLSSPGSDAALSNEEFMAAREYLSNVSNASQALQGKILANIHPSMSCTLICTNGQYQVEITPKHMSASSIEHSSILTKIDLTVAEVRAVAHKFLESPGNRPGQTH